jgi:hypothetical protein
MKIVFLCGCLEPGKDGVGDYTRLFAKELIKKGHLVSVIALNDKYIKTLLKEEQCFGNVDFPYLRLPSNLKSKKKFRYVKEWINSFDPEWLSLQFVPYAFNSKGLNYNLGTNLKNAGKLRRWHIMFHEIWQGESKVDPLKNVVLGVFQKYIILKMVKKIRPLCYGTSNNFYERVLAKNAISTTLLPVFNNLPIGNISGKALFNKLPQDILNNRGQYIIASFFGAIHFDEDLLDGFKKLQELVKNSQKKLVLTHLGKSEQVAKLWSYVNLSDNDYVYEFGQQSGQEIADYLCQIDVGLSTNPKILFEKSGSIAAMLNNKLPVILLGKGFEFDNRKIAYIKEVDEIMSLNDFIIQPKDFGEKFGVDNIAAKFENLLESY